MNNLFLTQEELLELTGYKYAKRQREWLTSEGVPFSANRMGRPMVKRCLFSQANVNIQQGYEPDFGAI